MGRIALKTKNDAHSEARRRLELYLSSLASVMFDRDVVVIATGRASAFQPAREWYFFKAVSGCEFAVCLDPEVTESRPSIYFETLIRVVCKLERAEVKSHFKRPTVIEAFGSSTGLNETRFSVFSAEEFPQYLGDLLHAEQPGQTIAHSDISVGEELRKTVESFTSRLVHGRAVWALALTTDSRISDVQARLTQSKKRFQLEVGTRHFETEHVITEKSIEFTVKENEMEKENGAESMEEGMVELRLCLGALELPLGDVFRLRAGEKIEFERTDSMEGVLQLGTQDWARVSVQVTDSTVEIELIEMLSLPNEISVSEETSAKNPRLSREV